MGQELVKATNSSSAESPTFEWVLITPDSKGHRPSKVDQRAIRRQAMKIVSNGWRRNGFHGRANIGQYPAFASHDHNNPLAAVHQHAGVRESKPELGRERICNYFSINASEPAGAPSIPGPMTLSSMERQRAMFCHDLLSLSTLTVAHVGSAVSIYLERPGRLISLLRQKKKSYLSHIPSRLGHSLCLDHAASAVLLKARGVLGISNPTHRTLMLEEQGNALRDLQAILNDPITRTQPDILCATELLGLIEVT